MDMIFTYTISNIESISSGLASLIAASLVLAPLQRGPGAKEDEPDERLLRELRAENETLGSRIERIEEFREGFIAILKDFDRSEGELLKAKTELREAQLQLVHSGKLNAIGEVAAGLAHELNQPLTVILGLVNSVMKNTGVAKNEMKKLDLIEKASTRMHMLITHLQAFSRLDETEMRQIDLNEVINNAFIIVEDALKKDSIKIKRDLTELPLIMGCAGKLEQVIVNLVTNARDAMPDGGVLSVRTTSTEVIGRKFIRAVFEDTGIGMQADVMSKIFQPFFTTKDTNKGTGLGLSISDGIIREHRGKMTVKSRPGAGTTFEIMLPVRK